ncbi:ribonuclease H protein, partial [Trifolium medium]|nr:ribonuclease H protein [Trifolium medium]
MCDSESLEKIVAITYGIWYARNQTIFQDKCLPPSEVCSIALAQLHEYQSFGANNLPNRPVMSGRRGNNTSWSPPPRGTLKMNVDAHLSSDGRWFSGLVLRQCDGSTIGATTRAHTGVGDAVFGEALGLNEALLWIEKIGLGRVIIELDSQILVNAVKKKSRVRKNWGYVVQR